jgi:hypothetical protein
MDTPAQKSIVYTLYLKDRCRICLRRSQCKKTPNEMILCSQNSFYKGPGQEDAIKNDSLIDNPVKICPHCGKEI